MNQYHGPRLRTATMRALTLTLISVTMVACSADPSSAQPTTSDRAVPRFNAISAIIDPKFAGTDALDSVPNEALAGLESARESGACARQVPLTWASAQGELKILCDDTETPFLIGGTIVPGTDITEVSVREKNNTVDVTLTPAGARQLQRYSAEHPGHRPGVIKNGKVCSAPLPAAGTTDTVMHLRGAAPLATCLRR